MPGKIHNLTVLDEDIPTPRYIQVSQYYCNYTFNLTAFDDSSNISQRIDFAIYNTNPYPNTPLYTLNSQASPMLIHIGSVFSLDFPLETLIDIDVLDKPYT